ncbi:MAG: HAD family hydrolase [Pirellulales bacterium]|nr:HAD family hydrolase [Pirellulales bacterium]
MTSAVEIFRGLARPIEPIPTGETPRLVRLPGIRAVLFDLYGTLLVSGSGDVGTQAAASDAAMAEALAAMGIQLSVPPGDALECLYRMIRARHDELRESGRDWPEIDVREVWSRVLDELVKAGGLDPEAREGIDVVRLAVEYEARANPAWPMPGARECLAALGEHRMLLGIVSNAQFYTLELLEAIFGCRAEPLGFNPALQFYSYQHGWGKPSRRLFEMAAGELSARSIEPAAAVYVGNDMLSDIVAARDVGFHTALFAGDARSLRRRADDPRVGGVEPELVLTQLDQLMECII